MENAMSLVNSHDQTTRDGRQVKFEPLEPSNAITQSQQLIQGYTQRDINRMIQDIVDKQLLTYQMNQLQ